MSAPTVTRVGERPAPRSLRVLREKLVEARETHGPQNMLVQQAFEDLFRESCKQGRPLDQLDTHNPNECERFFEQVIHGVDGHAYWASRSRDFTRNDGKRRSPRRYWYGHVNGEEVNQYHDVVPTCGERNCIAPWHMVTGRDILRRRFTDEQIIGTIQVTAMRLGRAPLSNEWDRMKLVPTSSVVRHRIGPGWADAMRRAGLEPTNISGVRGLTAETAKNALVAAAELLGHPPQVEEFRSKRVNDHLKKLNLPTSPGAIKKHLGGSSWEHALGLAGYKVGPNPNAMKVTPALAKRSIREATKILGHPPRYGEMRSDRVRQHLRPLGLPSSVNSIRAHIGPTWDDVLANARRSGVSR